MHTVAMQQRGVTKRIRGSPEPAQGVRRRRRRGPRAAAPTSPRRTCPCRGYHDYLGLQASELLGRRLRGRTASRPIAGPSRHSCDSPSSRASAERALAPSRSVRAGSANHVQGVTMKNIACSFLVALCIVASGALAQYPSRPIKLIVPIPAGGAPDIAARVVGQKLSELLGAAGRRRESCRLQRQHRRRPGREGAARRLHAALGQDSLIAINPHLYAKMPFDPLKDLVPVATLVRESVRARGQSVAARAEFPGVHRVRAPHHAAAAVRFRRQRQPAPSVDGNTEAARRHRSAARAVQGRGAGDDGDRRRRHGGDVRRHVDEPQIKAGQAACARGHRREALARVSRAADDRRVLSGLRSHDLARLFAPAGTPERIVDRACAPRSKRRSRRPTSSRSSTAAGGVEPSVTTPKSSPPSSAAITTSTARWCVS